MATEAVGSEPVYCGNCGSERTTETGRCPECGFEESGEGDLGTKDPSSRLLSAGVGALAAIFIGWFPLVGPAISGFAAGYLRGSDAKESAIAGTLGNVIASVPIILILALFMGLGTVGALVGGDGGALVGLFVWLLIFVTSFAYWYGLGALGGVLGAKVTDRGDPTS